MRIKFYVSQRTGKGDEKHYPHAIASALEEAVKLYSDDIEVVHNGEFEEVDHNVDVAGVWGLAGNASSIVSKYLARNKHVIIFDKALIRHLGEGGRGVFRVGIDHPSPVKYMMRVQRSFERFERRRIDLRPRVPSKVSLTPPSKSPRLNVLYCGSSQKYCNFHGLGDATVYAENVFSKVREIGKKIPLVYRPKPSWQNAVEIAGTEFSDGGRPLKMELSRARLLITHGSASAVEAVVGGVPAITLGPCAAQFVSGTHIDNETILDPFFPSDQARWMWLCALAYCQWSEPELRSGEAWGFIRNEIMELDHAKL